MKIVLLADQVITGGGAGAVAWNHARTLRAKGHEVIVISVTEDEGREGIVTIDGVTIYYLLTRYPVGLRGYISLNNRRIVKKIEGILSQIKPDIVHAHNVHLYLSYASLAVAQKYSRAVFLTAHDSMLFHYSKLFPSSVVMEGGEVKNYKVSSWNQLRLFKQQFNPFRNSIIRKYLKIPTKIFAVSATLAQALKDNGIGNVEVIHNGINGDSWQTVSSSVDKDKEFIFFGGRLSAAKGAEVLINAMKEVLPVRSHTRLLVVGEKNEYSVRMQKIAYDHGMDDLILFSGQKSREEMKGMYSLASIVVVPSLCFDWLPTNILEAMATKKPVIASCFGGAKEMVVDGVTGFIIDPRNPAALADKILFLLNNPAKAREMGEAGYARVISEFSEEKQIEKILAWYDSALRI